MAWNEPGGGNRDLREGAAARGPLDFKSGFVV